MQFILFHSKSYQKKILFIAIVSLLMCLSTNAQNKLTPIHLSVNRLFNTEQVFLNGYPTSTTLNEAISQRENYQFIEISTYKPQFGWIIDSDAEKILQTSYHVLLASSIENLQNDKGDLWDSGKVNSDQSINVQYNGNPLGPNKVYYWKVKMWDNHGNESDFSELSQFKTSEKLLDYATDRYPLQKQDDSPLTINQTDDNNYFVDFGKASFGRLRIRLYSDSENDIIILHLGEALHDNKINRSPGGTIRYSKYTVHPKQGWNTYIVTIKPDKINTGSQAILMPEYIGEVTPFR